jgi:molecular chaperone DnaK (HSP70)
VCAARRPSVGLDFGTSTTLVASTRGVVPIGTDMSWMPSLVGYADDGAIVTGEKARDLRPDQMVRSIKRAITERRRYVAVDQPTGLRQVRTDDLIAEVLREAGRRGARRGQDLGAGSLVRLGCPAMWDGAQRRRLLGAAQRADLPVVLATMVDEPVAAGIAWLSHRADASDAPQRVVVFDMGGGTLDVAVLDVRGGPHKDVTVLAALGVDEAGDALDEAIAEDLDLELAKLGIDIDALARPDSARSRLSVEARATKVLLSGTDEHVISLSPQVFGRTGEVWYTRDRLNEVFTPQMERAEEAVVLALRVARIVEGHHAAYDIARMTMDDLAQGVDVVLMSGGMCRIPFVRQRLEWLFDTSTRVELAMDPPENAVVVGLAKASDYGKISMYRPAFDILLEWNHAKDFAAVYEAYTPLVERSQLARTGADELRYYRSGRDLSLPRSAKGKLRVVSHSGERLRASLAGRNLDGFPVAVSADSFEFAIYPDGRIYLADGAGEYEGRVEDWHRLDHD